MCEPLWWPALAARCAHEKKGLLDPETRRMLLVPIATHSGDLSYVCTFRSNDENSVSCKIANEDLSTNCGTLSASRDPTGQSVQDPLY